MNKLKEINGKYYQEVEVVMLATEKQGQKGLVICKDEEKILHLYRADKFENKNLVVQNIYFLSNEEIKKPCWCINKNRDTVSFIQDNFETANEDWDKIIVTTDKGIQALKFIGTKKEAFSKILTGVKSQPSKSFIQACIKAYNENKPITKVLVEMVDNGEEDWIGDDFNGEPFWNSKFELKVNSSNEVTIKKVKDSWTREEVIIDIEKAMIQGLDLGQYRDKWIEKNL